jgi:phosphoribosylformylglycinamidine synthase subunit PurQ / glutaminase
MKFGVIVFPGSNCDLDAFHLVRDILQQPVVYIEHQTENLRDCDALILPGGFSYGDYLRSGAIARFSKIMQPVAEFAARGGLLPGALYRNDHLQFRCQQVTIRVENATTPFTNAATPGTVLKIPIAHGDGNYYAPPEIIQRMEVNRQILFRYTDEKGQTGVAANPNGSLSHIAGVCNEVGNVAGMMPHPERAGELILGSADGLIIFKSMLNYFLSKEAV